ncbi:hypothetical protein ACHAXR_008220 [Thalassiosira sp. AJA248-18]
MVYASRSTPKYHARFSRKITVRTSTSLTKATARRANMTWVGRQKATTTGHRNYTFNF